MTPQPPRPPMPPGGRPQGPPMGAVPDLGSLKDKPQEQILFSGEKPPIFVNDVQPRVQPGGTVVLTFSVVAKTQEGLLQGEPVSIAMPPAMFMALMRATPQVLNGARESMEEMAAGLGKFLQAADAAAVEEVRGSTPGGPRAVE